MSRLPGPGPQEFPTTRWSLVLAVGGGRDPEAREALSSLCARYRAPLYAYLRRRGVRADDAEDLLQEFFVHLLESDLLLVARRERGRLRCFLLSALRHLASDRWDRGRALKRGGETVHVPLDVPGIRDTLSVATAEADPERCYERRWALAIIGQALERLSAEYARAGRDTLFAALAPALAGERLEGSYRELADRLGTTEGALRVAAHRMRRRCRRLLQEVVADTVEDPSDVDAELRFLMSSLGA